jgi:hypothetical protein
MRTRGRANGANREENKLMIILLYCDIDIDVLYGEIEVNEGRRGEE